MGAPDSSRSMRRASAASSRLAEDLAVDLDDRVGRQHRVAVDGPHLCDGQPAHERRRGGSPACGVSSTSAGTTSNGTPSGRATRAAAGTPTPARGRDAQRRVCSTRRPGRRPGRERPADRAGHGVAGGADHGRLGDRQPRQPQRPPRPAGSRPTAAPAIGRYAGRRASGNGGLATRKRAAARAPACRAAPAGRPQRAATSATDIGTSVAPRRTATGRSGRRTRRPRRRSAARRRSAGGPQEAVDLGDVDPRQQVRIRRCVRPAVGRHAGDTPVDRPHGVDLPAGVGGRPNVVTARNWLVRASRPHGSPR